MPRTPGVGKRPSSLKFELAWESTEPELTCFNNKPFCGHHGERFEEPPTSHAPDDHLERIFVHISGVFSKLDVFLCHGAHHQVLNHCTTKEPSSRCGAIKSMVTSASCSVQTPPRTTNTFSSSREQRSSLQYIPGSYGPSCA